MELMRGQTTNQTSMLCLLSCEDRIPKTHPLRDIKALADEALAELSPLFDEMYAETGRPSVPPERLLKSMLLIALYTVRSERMLCEQLSYNLLYRWFLDMDMVEPAFDASTFSRNRDRLIEHDAAGQFFAEVVEKANSEKLLSHEHFSVDGTLIEAWASIKSFCPKDQDASDVNGWSEFRGQHRSNQTHESKTDPEAKLMRKGKGREAKLSFSGHALMENRHGLLLDMQVTQATGTAERETALEMIGGARPKSRRATLAADRGYDTRQFVTDCRELNVTPHVAQYQHARRRSAIDKRTTRHRGYNLSQTIRKRIEAIFGWMKTTGGLRRTRFRGIRRTQLAAYMVGAAYNLLRIAKLIRSTR
jgi:transposase